MTKKYLTISFGLIGLFGCATAQASSGSHAFSSDTNWDGHGVSHSGWTADLRYSTSRADTLRSGSDKIAADEVENLRTQTATLNYTYDDHWGVMLRLPYEMRYHKDAHNPGSRVDGLGDIKVVGNYRWALDETNRSGMGVKFGLKLNTGKQDFTFAQASGNGSTDLIAGAHWHQSAPGSDWNWFAQGMLQNSIKSDATFRPGKQINLDGGTRYVFSHNLSGLLQLNAQWNAADSGDSAALTVDGAASSGGRIFSITPGLGYTLAHGTQVYGLVQLPLYQYLNGEQLTTNSYVSVGISHHF